MSYDVYTAFDLGAGEISVGPLDENMTYNIGAMIAKADGQWLGDWRGIKASKAAKRARAVVAKMDSDWPAYEALNPSNGWGSAQGCRDFMVKIAEGCEAVPRAIFRVC